MSNRRRSLFFLFTTLEFPPRVTTHKINLTPGGRKGGVKGGPPNFWNNENKRVSTNARSRLVSVDVGTVLGPPGLALHT